MHNPNAIYHVGISGGKDSSAALLFMVHESGVPKAQIRATFCDIGNDHAWTLEHIALLSRTVHPIETIRPELDFFALARKKKRFPSTKVRFCTQKLKIEPTFKHIADLLDSGKKVIAVSGVRADESEDRSKLEEWDLPGMFPAPQWRPLIRWTLADVFAIHKKYNVPLNPLYGIGAQRVGCWPCIMSRKAEIRTIALKFPERINELRAAEQRFETENGRYSSFFPRNAVPLRFRSKDFTSKKGEQMKIATIDDVVKWSMTGKRAKGSYLDETEEPRTCQSGMCE